MKKLNPIYSVPISSKSQKLSKFYQLPTFFDYALKLRNVTDFSDCTKPRRLEFVFDSLKCHHLFLVILRILYGNLCNMKTAEYIMNIYIQVLC